MTYGVILAGGIGSRMGGDKRSLKKLSFFARNSGLSTQKILLKSMPQRQATRLLSSRAAQQETKLL